MKNHFSAISQFTIILISQLRYINYLLMADKSEVKNKINNFVNNYTQNNLMGSEIMKLDYYLHCFFLQIRVIIHPGCNSEIRDL